MHGQWSAGLPDATLGRFSGDDKADKQALDAWAAERTGGLIPAMPLRVDKAPLLVLAAAQAVRTRWLSPFHTTGLVPDDEGPWAGRSLVGLSRRTSPLDRVGVAQTPAGRPDHPHVLGNIGVDVRLPLGERVAAPGAVLAAGIDVLSGTDSATPGGRLPLGETGRGLNVQNVLADGRDPVLSVTTYPFSVTADHDMFATSALFGLSRAMDVGPLHRGGRRVGDGHGHRRDPRQRGAGDPLRRSPHQTRLRPPLQLPHRPPHLAARFLSRLDHRARRPCTRRRRRGLRTASRSLDNRRDTLMLLVTGATGATGATGNIGSALLKELHAYGAGPLRGLTRDAARPPPRTSR